MLQYDKLYMEVDCLNVIFSNNKHLKNVIDFCVRFSEQDISLQASQYNCSKDRVVL